MPKARAEAPSTSEKPRWLAGPAARLSALSRNPLAIALVVALLGNFFIPRILDDAEANRRALDLKANLATQMGGSSTAALTQGELFATDVVRKANVDVQGAFNDGWRDWTNASAEVDAQVAAYFGRARDFTERWQLYREAVGAMYLLSATGLKGERCKRVGQVSAAFSLGGSSPATPVCNDPSLLNDQKRQKKICLSARTLELGLLAACDGNDQKVSGYQRGPRFYVAYTTVSKRLLDLGRVLVRELVGLTPSGF